jgi:hypothetical protein
MVIKVPGVKNNKGTLLTEATHYSKAIRQELDEIAAKQELLMLNLFSPDWDRLATIPTGTIESLVAQSVGLVPALANPDFINAAKRFFSARNDSASISKLTTFLRRLADAREIIAPLGELQPIEGKETRFKKSDFLALAGRLGWALPEEFKRLQGADSVPSKATSRTSTQNKTKILIPKTRDKSESLLLIYSYFEWKGLNPGDTVNISAKQAWGEIHAGNFETDLIKSRSGDRKTAQIIMNGGEEMDEQTFVKKYNSRLKTPDKIG